MLNQDKFESYEEIRPVRLRKTAERFSEYTQLNQIVAPKAKKAKKIKEHGWYKVDRIEGLRVIREKKNKDFIELKVSWEGYTECSWERFDGFVKDAA
jgi:hypothetical protein